MKLRLPFLCFTGLFFLGAPSCVSPPTPAEVLATGFRSPEMTFRTFQVAVRGDLPRLEYACFSGSFRALHGLSQFTYREAREKLLKKEIAYWLGIPDAKVVESVSLAPDRHLIRAKSHGIGFELVFVREDFFQLWEGETRLADEPLAPGTFEEQAEVFSQDSSLTMVSGFAELPQPLTLRPVDDLNRNFTEFRIGREWKIDSIGQSEASLDL
ncbi:MAG: hypothetical protein ACI9F9_001545 [Candidatus Paceibacteria bacterium]|jgi:hypothetical protein